MTSPPRLSVSLYLLLRSTFFFSKFIFICFFLRVEFFPRLSRPFPVWRMPGYSPPHVIVCSTVFFPKKLKCSNLTCDSLEGGRKAAVDSSSPGIYLVALLSQAGKRVLKIEMLIIILSLATQRGGKSQSSSLRNVVVVRDSVHLRNLGNLTMNYY
jgi:hypothetical protein